MPGTHFRDQLRFTSLCGKLKLTFTTVSSWTQLGGGDTDKPQNYLLQKYHSRTVWLGVSDPGVTVQELRRVISLV